MSHLAIAPIVEGHGEVASARKLLERIWRELLGGQFVEVLRPIREKRHRLSHNTGAALERAIELAAGKLSALPPDLPRLILVLVDANTDPPCVLGPQMLQTAQSRRSDQDITCIIANVEYETWFAAAAESLTEYLDLSGDSTNPTDPESQRCGKSWIEKRFKGVKYSETVDQPKMTARMDLALCRSRSPSFDKLCRELEKRLPPATAEGE